MFGINLKHSLATVAVATGVLAAAGSASAATHQSDAILYNGHAGLGASVYQHDQTDLEFLASSPRGPGSEGFRLGSKAAPAASVKDGTSNTIMFAVIESIGTKYTVFLPLHIDATTNELAILPDIDDQVL